MPFTFQFQAHAAASVAYSFAVKKPTRGHSQCIHPQCGVSYKKCGRLSG
jgi:hypothetical protein